MSTLVDPRICPDCRAPLDPDLTCTGCGLRLIGPTASELWQVLLRADGLIDQLRRPPGDTAAPPPPPQRLAPPPHPAPRAPSVSVPVVLLSLGALCVLVAAVVFVAVTWSSLGLGAKASIMLGVTGLFAARGTVLARRGLRGAAETLWVIVAALLVVDLVAVHGADLAGFGAVAPRHAAGLTGAVLLLVGTAVSAWVRTTPTGHLNGMVATTATGTLVLTVAEVLAADRPEVAATAAFPVVLGLATAVRRVGLRPSAIMIGASAVLPWVVLLAVGIDRSSRTDVLDWWQDLAGWPLLVAAGYAALLTLGERLPDAVRFISSSATLLALVCFAIGGSARQESTTLATACGIAIALAAVSAYGSRIWAGPAGVMALLGFVVGGLLVAGRPWESIAGLPTTGPADDLNLDLRLPTVAADPAPWTALLLAVAVAITAAGLLRHLPEAFRRVGRTGWIALAPTVLALGAVTAFLENEPRLVLAVLAWSVVLVLAAWGTVTAAPQTAALTAALVVGGYLAVVGLRLAVSSHLLVAVLASTLAVGLGIGYGRARTDGLRGALLPVLSGAALIAAGFACTHWPYLVDGAGDTAGIVLVGFVALALLAAAPAGRTEPARLTIEAVAVGLGLLATRFPTDPAVPALILTVLGTALALAATLNRDRALLAWGAVVVLGIATILRLDRGVDAPEIYTVPAALLLLAGGIHRVRTDPACSSLQALSSGLVLGLLPSLLLALDEPVTVRGALVAATGLLVLAAGVRARYAAPVLAGAVTTGLLALRHLGPVAEAVPRWVSLAAVGLVLLLVGITWEARRRNVATADRYLRSLR